MNSPHASKYHMMKCVSNIFHGLTMSNVLTMLQHLETSIVGKKKKGKEIKINKK